MRNRTGFLAAIPLLFTQLFFCAKIESPPGGPPDITPPEIIAVSPAIGQLNVPLDVEIRIGFSEKISKEDIASQIIVVPQPESAPKISWKGKELLLSFKDSLRENQTYLITLKTDLRDLRNNKLTQPYKLAFSTGEHLDSGKISGHVFLNFKPAEGADIWAYRADSNFTLFDNSPLYVTQTSDSGKYDLEYLADGRYLCFAVKDKAGNRLYDPQDDLLGLPSDLIVISAPLPEYSGVDFDLHKRDTSGLKIVSVEFSADNLVSAKLSAMVYVPALISENFEVVSKDSGGIMDFAHIYSYSDSADKILLQPLEMPKKGMYHLRIRDFVDIQGNHIADGQDTASFELDHYEDTDPPRLVSSYPKENEKDFPADQDFIFIFSEPIQIDSSDTAIIYLSIEDSLFFYDLACRSENLTLTCRPAEQLKSDQSYTLHLNLPKILDRSGINLAGDSADSFRFSTENLEEYGAISGRLVLGPGYDKDFLRIFLSSLDSKSKRRISFDDSLKFYIDMPAGRYFFYGFDDVNGNDAYDWGVISPLRFAERLFIFKDTVSVRSRFETEDVSLEMK